MPTYRIALDDTTEVIEAQNEDQAIIQFYKDLGYPSLEAAARAQQKIVDVMVGELVVTEMPTE